MLELKNIAFSYDIKPVIHDISFAIHKGQNIAVIGESGCGKSTLLKLIYGLYDLNEGEIIYNKKAVLAPSRFPLISQSACSIPEIALVSTGPPR